jgi:hypothetical protein
MSAFRILFLITAFLAVPGLVSAQWGVAPDGTKGRLHVVEKGDTLWDITEEYLGTPWIWPSVWKENEIENPHVIQPGDLIWITQRGMRKLTPEEAARIVPADGPTPAAQDSSGTLGTPLTSEPEPKKDSYDPFASLDGASADIEHVINYPGLHRYGFVTPQELDGAGAVLGSHEDNYWTSQEKRTIVSVGEGQAHVGDRYTFFRTRRRVKHPDTHQDMGYFVQILGSAEVTEVHPESSFVRVITAYSEIEPGDRLIPYEEPPDRFKVEPTDQAYNGIVLAKQPYRLYVGESDLILIDRGSFDGVAVGNELELYRAGKEVLDPVTGAEVLVPDDILGKMFVLKVGPRTSLALIRKARRDIQVGDHFRSL